jgi:hypothetical protein
MSAYRAAVRAFPGVPARWRSSATNRTSGIIRAQRSIGTRQWQPQAFLFLDL